MYFDHLFIKIRIEYAEVIKCPIYIDEDRITHIIIQTKASVKYLFMH